MASGPMRQSVPLADTIRQMSGDAAGLAKELRREREKLEREINKTIDSAGQVDHRLTQKLDKLRQREQAAGVAAMKQTDVMGAKREMMDVRAIGGKIRGVAELASGQFNLRNVDDLAELLGLAGEQLAKKGALRWGNRLAKVGRSVSEGIVGFGIPAMAAVATWSTFHEMGTQLGDFLFGNPQEMEQDARKSAALQSAIWSNRNRLGSEKTARLLGMTDNPWLEASMMRDSGPRGQKMYEQASKDFYARPENRSLYGYWIDPLFKYQPWARKGREKEEAEWVTNRMKELAQKEAAKRGEYEKDAGHIRDRAISNERAQALRALEEEQFNRRQDWSGF